MKVGTNTQVYAVMNTNRVSTFNVKSAKRCTNFSGTWITTLRTWHQCSEAIY